MPAIDESELFEQVEPNGFVRTPGSCTFRQPMSIGCSGDMVGDAQGRESESPIMHLSGRY